MARPAFVVPLVMALTSCVPEPGFDRASGAVEADPAPPQVRQDLQSWTCRSDLTAQPVAFFDADSTLRVSKSGVVTADGPYDVNILPFVATKIAELNRLGYLVAVVSNQGGVGSNAERFAEAQSALAYTVSQIRALGGRIDYFDFAEFQNGDRKPGRGMGDRLNGLLTDRCGVGIDMPRSFMVGDSAYKRNVDGPNPADPGAECGPIVSRPADDFSNADRGFARSFDDIYFVEPNEYFGWRFFQVPAEPGATEVDETVPVYNIENAAQLLALIEAIEAKAASTRDPSRAMVLRNEAAALRRVNEPFQAPSDWTPTPVEAPVEEQPESEEL